MSGRKHRYWDSPGPLAGDGTVTYTVNGQTKTIQVAGTPNSYQLLSTKDNEAGAVDVTVGKGAQAFSFTFG